MSLPAVIDWLDAQQFSDREPGFVIGLQHLGQPLLIRGVGKARVDSAVPLSASTPMRVFSLAKQFTCLAYARLAESGALGIDSAFADHLPDLAPGLTGISARHLMTHSSGLLDACDMHWSFGSASTRVGNEDLVRYYTAERYRNFAPGAGWCYNNGAYQLLTVAIERAAGQPLEAVLQDLIFRPLGMAATSIARSSADIPDNAADLHVAQNGSFAPNRGALAGDLTGDAGLVTTVADMLVWLATFGREATDGCARVRLQTQRLQNGFDSHYGMGIAQGRYSGMPTIFHPGGGVGGNAYMMSVPEQAVDVIVIANRDDLSSRSIAEQALDRFFGRTAQAPENPPWPAGTYHAARSGRVLELLAGGDTKRRHARIDGRNVEVVGNLSRSMEVDAALAPMRCRIERRPGADGVIELHECGEVEHLGLTKPATTLRLPNLAEFSAPAAEVEAQITRDEDGYVLRTRCAFGSASFRLAALADTVWRAVPLDSVPWAGGICTFDPAYRQFLFTGSRVRALPFVRVA